MAADGPTTIPADRDSDDDDDEAIGAFHICDNDTPLTYSTLTRLRESGEFLTDM